MRLLFLAMFLGASALAAPPLSCTGDGELRIAPAGNGLVSAVGTYRDDLIGPVKLSCVGEMISFGALPGFGEKVETFWFRASPQCPFEFLQLDDSAYAGGGPARLTCSQAPCAARSFRCAKAR